MGHRAEPADQLDRASTAPATSSPGSTFSHTGQTLFVNIQASRGMTFAIWGPWGQIGV